MEKMSEESTDMLERVQKRMKRPRWNRKSDRISSLHDSILYHILFFLPIEDIVQTSILSKRWKKLWISLPYLCLDESNCNRGYADFVKKFLHYRNNSRIIRLRLLFGSDIGYQEDDDTWINDAVSAGVEELQLQTIKRGSIKKRYFMPWNCLPTCILTCSSLLALELDLGYEVIFFEPFSFPKMKRMNLAHIIVAQNFTHQLLNCPNLEDLFLRCCKVRIGTSSNSNIVFTDDRSSGILSKLNKASIHLIYDPIDSISLWLCKFFRKLCNAKDLRLEYSCIKILRPRRDLLEQLPTFCNLKQLEVELDTRDGDVRVMLSLLHCSTVLQSLHIRFLNSKSAVISERFPSLSVPRSLKLIRTNGFCGEKNQNKILRLLQNNGSKI